MMHHPQASKIIGILVMVMLVVFLGTRQARASAGWTLVPSPNVGSSSQLFGVAPVSAQDVWAVGTTGINEQTITEHWDGSSWGLVSSPSIGILEAASAVAANDVWAVGRTGADGGSPLIEHWDGSAWSVVPEATQVPGDLRAVAAFAANDVWAVGFTGFNSSNRSLIEHWDGTSWRVVPSPSIPGASENELNSVVARANNDVWVVGTDYYAGVYFTLVEQWDGTSWSVVPSPSVGNISSTLYGVTAVPNTNELWAVGLYMPNHTTEQPLAEQWDGTSWRVVPSPSESLTSSNFLSGVAAFSQTDVWATGVVSDHAPPLVEHWDGTSWTIDTSLPALNGSWFQGLARVPGTSTLWAVGHSSADYRSFQTLTAFLNADTTPPVLGVPNTLIVNATSSAGASVPYTVTATDPDNAPSALTIACSPGSGSTFPIGTTTVTCTASDPAGNTSQASFQVVVLSPTTVTFDDISPVTPLNGTYAGIKWGTSVWDVDGPITSDSTNSISFHTSTVTGGTFAFVTPQVLLSMQIESNSSMTAMITLSCAGNPTVSAQVAPGATATLTTYWQTPCTTVTVTSSNSWNTNLDNLVYSSIPNSTQPPNQPPPPTNVYGYPVQGALLDTGDANYMNGSKFTTGTTGGTAQSMSVLVGNVDSGSHNKYQLAIYSDNNGTPGTLLAQSAIGTLTPLSWNTLTISATLQPNTTYWLMYNTNATTSTNYLNNLYFDRGAQGVAVWAKHSFGSWPTTFPTPTFDTTQFSMYVTYQ